MKMDLCFALLKSSMMWRRFALFMFIVASRDVSVSPMSTNITVANFQNTEDKFTIFDPVSPCRNSTLNPGLKQEWCARRNATSVKMEKTCSCKCSGKNGVIITFLLGKQACFRNRDVYTLLGGKKAWLNYTAGY